MTAAIEPTPLRADGVTFPLSNSAMAMAGIASLGAGAIHAAAAGSHSEHRQAVLAFVIVAAFQLGWGALALVRFGSLIALAGVAGNGAALGGWLMAKSNGISFVDGLEAPEGLQFADSLAAVFALLAVVGAIVAFWRGPAAEASRRSGCSSLPSRVSAVAALTLPAMVSAGGHAHAHGDADDHGAHTATAAGDGSGASGGSGRQADPGHQATASDDHAHPDEGATDAVTGGTAPPPAVVPPVPYDPTKPIDLGGVAGRHARAAGRGREPHRRHARPAAAVVPTTASPRPTGSASIGDGAHRRRALHQLGLHRRRQGPRPRPPGVAGVRAAAGRSTQAGRGDVHAADRVDARRRARHRRRAHAVAHPRQPLLHRRPGAHRVGRRSPAAAASARRAARSSRRRR